jgi:hypothetical protein
LWDESREHAEWKHSGEQTVALDDRDIHSIPSRLGWDAVTTQQWRHLVADVDAPTESDLEEHEQDYLAEQESKRKQKEKEREKEEQRRQDEEDDQEPERESTDDDDDETTEDVGDGIRVSGNEDDFSAGDKYYTPREIAGLVGAQPGSHVKVSSGERGAIRVDVESDDISDQTRYIYHDHIYNSILVLNRRSQGKGLGARIFSGQVEAASKAGLKYIETSAAGSGEDKKRNPMSMNGYYTWPLFGYDAPLGRALGRDKVAEATAKFKLGDSPNISDVIDATGGPAWWKESGSGTKMKFDLAKGSRSRRMLAKYLHNKFGKGRGWQTSSADKPEPKESEPPARKQAEPKPTEKSRPGGAWHVASPVTRGELANVLEKIVARPPVDLPSATQATLKREISEFRRTGNATLLRNYFTTRWPGFDIDKALREHGIVGEASKVTQ